MGDIVAELTQALGADRVLAGQDVPARNRHDWSGLPASRPLAVVLPRQTAEVATALRLCNAAGVAVVPQGGLTGLCGGARPGDGRWRSRSSG